MWPFSKSPWRKVEEGMKSIYPSDRTGLDYLSELPCPFYVRQLCVNVYLRNDKRSIAAIQKWLAIMRSSRNDSLRESGEKQCSINGSGSK